MPDTSDIRIVLVETSHPGNIGAAARAMKNMELERAGAGAAAAVPAPGGHARAPRAPTMCWRARASVPTLAAGARRLRPGAGHHRARARPVFPRARRARAAARARGRSAPAAPVAVLFGAERAGLTNERARACARAAAHSGQSRATPSLNLAMAVQIVAYEICCARRGAQRRRPRAAAPSAAGRPGGRWSGCTRISAQVLEEIDFATAPRAART